MQKRMVAEEREAIVLLSAIDTALRRYNGSISRMAERRGKEWGEGEGSVFKAIDDLIEDLLLTVPMEQLNAIRNQMLMSDIHIGIRNAQRPKDLWLITYEEGTALANALVESKCLFCELNANEACPYRDLLDSLPVDTEGSASYKIHCKGGL